VFLVTGVPAIVAGVVTLFYLDDKPQAAKFLDADEKAWLAATLAAEDIGMRKTVYANPFSALLDLRVLAISLWYVSMPLGAYGVSYWLPTLVKGFGVSNTLNGWINVIPWAIVAFALWYMPRLATRTGRPTLFIVGPLLVGAACLAASVYAPGNVLQFALICIAAAGIFAAQPVFWTLPSSILTGASAAAGLACVNSIGNLGGFVAQNAVPLIRDQTGSTTAPLLFVAACVAVGGVATFAVQGFLRRSRLSGAYAPMAAE
jgi:cyanate permease